MEPITIRGKEFKSLAAACRHHELSYAAVKARQRYTDRDLEHVIEDYLKGNVGGAEEFIFRGKKYSSLKEACEHFDLIYGSVVARKIRLNLTCVEALEQDLAGHVKKVQPFTYRGVEYKSLHEACLLLDLSYSAVRFHQKHKGGKIHDILDFYRQKRLREKSWIKH